MVGESRGVGANPPGRPSEDAARANGTLLSLWVTPRRGNVLRARSSDAAQRTGRQAQGWRWKAAFRPIWWANFPPLCIAPFLPQTPPLVLLSGNTLAGVGKAQAREVLRWRARGDRPDRGCVGGSSGKLWHSCWTRITKMATYLRRFFNSRL